MANKRDYYEVLGIDKNATDEDIKRAYRKKAKECHPDLHPNDKEAEARFKELNEANEVLSDPDKRARYDQFGFDGPDMGGGAGGNPFGGMDFSGMGGMGDIFDQLFNGGMGGSAQARRNAPRQGKGDEKLWRKVLERGDSVLLSAAIRIQSHENEVTRKIK